MTVDHGRVGAGPPGGSTAPPAAWVIGAGSGVGAALVRQLALRGYSVALSGRRLDRLQQTRAEARDIHPHSGTSGEFMVQPLDVTQPDAIADAHESIAALLGPISVLVFAAGLNTPRRAWKDLTPAETQAIYSTNLTAPTQAVSLVLPGMREAAGGTIILVSSIAAWQHTPGAGVAYSASKSGLSVLAEHINSSEGVFGVRATSVAPGDIDTEFLSMRPDVPDEQARKAMLTPDDVAAAVATVLDQPSNVCINELVITPVR